MTDGEVTTRSPARRIRRVIVAIIVASFGIAALGGIVVLLGGDLGDPAWRVLGTTAIVGAFSVGVLCNASLIGRRAQPFGYAGAGVSIAAAAMSVWLVWDDTAWSDGVSRTLWTLIAVSAASAVCSLLLLLSDHGRRGVRLGLIATLALIAIGVVLSLLPVWGAEFGDWDVYGRVVGIVWILAALGVVVLPVLSLLLRSRPDDGISAALSPATAARIVAEAERAGMTTDAFVERLLARTDR